MMLDLLAFQKSKESDFEKYCGDVIYDIWRAGGNPDLINIEQMLFDFEEPISQEKCFKNELKRQQYRQNPERPMVISTSK